MSGGFDRPVVVRCLSIGVLLRTLGYDESENKKTFEIDTDLGAIQKYGK